MNNIAVNTTYFQHSTPEYNKKHREEISKYNHEYYEENKEKWEDDESNPLYEKYRNLLSTLNGGSKKVGSSGGKKSSSKKEKAETKGKSSEKETKEKKTKNGKDVSEMSQDSLNKEHEKLIKRIKDFNPENDEEKKAFDELASRLKEIDDELKKRNKKEDEKEEVKEDKEEVKEKKERSFKIKSKIDPKYTDGPIIKEKKKNITSKIDPKMIDGPVRKKHIKHSSIYVGVNSQPYFEHHGRLGMKWGKKNGPPYPLDYSKLSEEERAKDKERVKAEGDIESVGYKKNRSYFSDQEINEVINRYQLNSRINQLAADSAKMRAGKSKVDQLKDNLQTVSDVGFKLGSAIQAGSNVYNHVAKIMNAFGDSDMPIIGEKKQKESKINKLSKLELDKYINNIDKLQGTLSSNEIKDLVQRANQIKQLETLRDNKKQDTDISNLEKGNRKVELENKRLELMNQRAEMQDKREAQRKEQMQQQIQQKTKQEAQKLKVNYDPAESQRVKDEYTKAVKEANEAEAKFRRNGYDDLDRREAAVKDAKLELATKALNDQMQKDNYKPTSQYSAVEKFLHKNEYDRSAKIEKAQKDFADEQQRKRIEAEEKAIEEERRKRGQEWTYEWLD